MSTLRSLTRLVVGAALLGMDSLSERMQVWEQGEPDPEAAPGQTPALVDLRSDDESAVDASAITFYTPAENQEDIRLRHAIVGLIFDLQDSLGRGLTLANRASRLAGNIAEPFLSPVVNSRVASPLRTRFDSLADRGAAKIEHWVAIGEAEDAQSRAMTTTAVVDGVDIAVDYLASDEKVQDLIQSQSVGMIDEILEETRERTVSADNLLEMLVRNMLRKTPRTDLPGPPPAVMEQATPFRRVQGVLKRR